MSNLAEKSSFDTDIAAAIATLNYLSLEGPEDVRAWLRRSREAYLSGSGFQDADDLEAYLDHCVNVHDEEPAEDETENGSPLSIIADWRKSPRLPIVPTGIAPLDELCGGGFRIPRRVMIVGAPGGSKTGLAVCIGDNLESGGFVIGFHAVDEEPEDILMRLAQIAGLDRAKLLDRDAAELDEAERKFSDARFRFYDYDWTIEDAAADVAKLAADLGTQAALIIDSIQTVRCKANKERAATGPREYVEANVAAFRKAISKHRLLGIATSEANRASYREGNGLQNPMASAAETRSIEFAAQTMLFMTADEMLPDVFKVQVVKNRALQLGDFSLRMRRQTHTYAPVSSGTIGFERETKKDSDKAERDHVRALKSAVDVARVLIREPGITKNRLHEALRQDHGTYDEKRVDRGICELSTSLEVRDGPNNSKQHYLDRERLKPEIAAALAA